MLWETCIYVRSEEHTSELQSHDNLVCRLLLEKKKQLQQRAINDNHLLLCTHDSHATARARSTGRGSLCSPTRSTSISRSSTSFFFFFNDTATPEIYPLSLPDALPILIRRPPRSTLFPSDSSDLGGRRIIRSEKNTFELPPPHNPVSRLLL